MSNADPSARSSETGGTRPFWATRVGKYGVGAVLLYATCVLLAGSSFSNEFNLILELGLLAGTFLFVLFAPVHFLLQFLGHLLISRFFSSRRSAEGIFLNIPALVLLTFALVIAIMPSTQTRLRRGLQAHFAPPLPGSVHVNSFQFSRGLNHGSYTYLLSINPEELGNFLSSSGCTVTNESSLALSSGSEKIVSAQLIRPYEVYTAQTNSGITRISKLIIVSSNRTDVAFIESFF